VANEKSNDFENKYRQTLNERETVENKLAMLSSEIERLGVLTRNKQNEIDKMQQNL
jgi:peptidoglycan hydrolase CwlO-like protein